MSPSGMTEGTYLGRTTAASYKEADDASSYRDLMAQAIRELRDTVGSREDGAIPGPLAHAILGLMENSVRLHHVDQLTAMASNEDSTDEARSWQRVSLLTSKYCRDGLLKEQRMAIRSVCELMEKGSPLCLARAEHVVGSATENEMPHDTGTVTAIMEVTNIPSEEAATSDSAGLPQVPPGVWSMPPPPGLQPPPDVAELPAKEAGTAVESPPALRPFVRGKNGSNHSASAKRETCAEGKRSIVRTPFEPHTTGLEPTAAGGYAVESESSWNADAMPSSSDWPYRPDHGRLNFEAYSESSEEQ